MPRHKSTWSLAEVREMFFRAFPAGSLRGNELSACLQISTGTRIKREPIESLLATASRVVALCAKEESDREDDRQWRAEAKRYGATILGYARKSNRIALKYVTRRGFCRLDTIERARETKWGQTRIRQGERLSFAVLLECFPSVPDWHINSRPAFLRGMPGAGPLELDIYSPQLRLALEHQGAHHVDDALVRQRDRWKRRRCTKRGIDLIALPIDTYKPAIYIQNLLAALREVGRSPEQLPNPDCVGRRWNELCEDPWRRYREDLLGLLKKVGHELLAPKDVLSITPDSQLTIRCGHCGRNSEIDRAKSLRSTSRGCQHCKWKLAGHTKRKGNLRRFSHLSQRLQNQLAINSEVIECLYGHKTTVPSLQYLLDRIDADGELICYECRARVMSRERPSSPVTRYQAATLAQAEETAVQILSSSGLSQSDAQWLQLRRARFREGQEWHVALRCPAGHINDFSLREWGQILKSKYLQDSCAPHHCQICAYPVDGPCRRRTVWHRLQVIRQLYPRASYLCGFDTRGKSKESYDCGYTFADGSNHPPIRVSAAKLQRCLRNGGTVHLCYVCGSMSGATPEWKGKTLPDIDGRHKAISDALGVVPDIASRRFVKISGSRAAAGAATPISTTRTLLEFWCGVLGHPTVTTVADNYFNPAKGYGYCHLCIERSAVRHAMDLWRGHSEAL